MDTIAESPVRLGDILGAAQIGDLSVITVEFGQSGRFPIGTVMSLVNGRVVGANDANADDVFGVLVEERDILDIATERRPTANVARHGTFKAGMLTVEAGSNLRNMVVRLRELGILLEGVEAREAPPFRIRTLSPNNARPNIADVLVTINLAGSIPNTATLLLNGVAAVPPAVWVNHATMTYTFPNTGATTPSFVRFRVRVPGATPVDSNEVMFQISD